MPWEVTEELGVSFVCVNKWLQRMGEMGGWGCETNRDGDVRPAFLAPRWIGWNGR